LTLELYWQYELTIGVELGHAATKFDSYRAPVLSGQGSLESRNPLEKVQMQRSEGVRQAGSANTVTPS